MTFAIPVTTFIIMNAVPSSSTVRTSGYVSARWLADHLDANWLRILDVRGPALARDDRSGARLRLDDDPPRFVELGVGGEWHRAGKWPRAVHPAPAFIRGHIPGSTSLDVGDRLFDTNGALVSAPELAMAMSEAGVGDEHTVILVDDACPTSARVAAWALRRYGHADTLILTGGFPRWVAEGRPVTQAVAKHPFGSFTARTRS